MARKGGMRMGMSQRRVVANQHQKLQNDWQEKSSLHINKRIAGRRILYVAMERRARRKKLHKIAMALLMAVAFFSGFFGRTLFDAYAKEESDHELQRYYTSIQLEPGDNLWKIANRYAEKANYTAAEYVEELKRMNRLPSEQVHSGEYLTIVYLAE